jgi:uncharacterized protein YjbI with pentapeptide repeats
MKKLILSVLVFAGAISQAKDLGFRYNNGQCVDANGTQGYNPSYIGQCGDLRGVVISNFNLDDTDLRGSVFDNSDLQGTTLRNSDLTGVSFVTAQLSGVDFTNSKLIDVKMHAAVLVNAHLADAVLSNIDFSEANFQQAQLSFLDCQKCNFAKVDMSGADMDSANFSGSDFSGAVLREANLANASMDGIKIDGAIFERADLTDASFKAISGEKASINGVSGKGANFEGSQLKALSLRRSQLENSNFKNSDLSMGDFRGAALPGANFQGTVLQGAVLSKKTVLPISMDEATQRGMAFAKASLLIIADTSPQSTEMDSLVKFMDDEGVETVVAQQTRANFDGTMDLTDYTSILLLYNHSDDMPSEGQKALVKFVQGGGLYISTGMVNHMWSFHDYLRDMRDLQFMREDEQENATYTFKPATGQESHPLLEGLQGKSMKGLYSTCNALETYGTNEPLVIASDDNGSPLLAIRNIGDGRAINFPLALSGDQDYQGMTNPVFQQLMINAVNW